MGTMWKSFSNKTQNPATNQLEAPVGGKWIRLVGGTKAPTSPTNIAKHDLTNHPKNDLGENTDVECPYTIIHVGHSGMTPKNTILFDSRGNIHCWSNMLEFVAIDLFPLPKHSGINPNRVLLFVALKYFVPMSGLFTLWSITLGPKQHLLYLSCDHKCRANVCFFCLSPDLLVVPRLVRPSTTDVPTAHLSKQLITNTPAAHPVLIKKSSDSPDDRATFAWPATELVSSNAPSICDGTTSSCASSQQMRGLHPTALPSADGVCLVYHPHHPCHCSNCSLAHTRHHHGHLELNRFDGPSGKADLWKFVDSTSDTLSLASTNFFMVSFVSNDKTASPAAKANFSMHSCTCMGSGFHQRAPSLNSTVLRRKSATPLATACLRTEIGFHGVVQ